MTRFEEKTSPFIVAGVLCSVAAIYVADFFLPLGVAAFVLYMVPVTLTFFSWRPAAPLWMAGICTLLTILDFLTASETGEFAVARLNRSFGVLSLFLVAAIGYQFINIRRAIRREAWMQKCKTRLAEQLVGELRLESLGDKVLSFLGNSLDAKVGAFFVEDGHLFRRHAIYATGSAAVPEHFNLGEGMLGQAVKEARTLTVENLPENHLMLESGLGSSRPGHLLVIPVTHEGHVNAVIELGFFQPIENADRELLDVLDDLIGEAVRSVKYRTRLQELLEETRKQSEEVQAQSEELRVSNEELEEQGRALRESQSRLELQQTELEQTNVQLEEQAFSLERQRNDLVIAKESLEHQAREVEQASRYKSNFLANMSHELRTPLNSSLILAKLLGENRSGNLTEEQVKYAVTIESAGNDLLALINDVLDLSKIEAGHMEINPEPVRVSQILDHLRGTFEPIADEKEIDLRVETAPSTPESVVTDSHRLEQVLRNLLSNAHKFTEKGTVTLRASASQDQLAFTVSDTGIGIAPEKQKIIFDPFFQADGTTARKYGGTGLGLSISRNLIRLLGGEISLESELGRGSSFTVRIPLEYAEAAAQEPADTHRPPPPAANLEPELSSHFQFARIPDDREEITPGDRVILTVEDDEPFARIIYDLAREMNFRCLIATSAGEGLMLARQLLPSAIVLDVGLPDNSGLSVLERLKSDPKTRHIPVHVVSASDYTQTALALGAVGYMLKPVKREQLVDAFGKLEDQLTRGMRRVLVVEDDAVQADAMRDLLGSRDVEAVCARTASECLDQLRATTFDCMVLDLSLPDASGFSLLETLSIEDTYSFPPVIVYTGRVLTANEEQRLRRYSRSIIIKGAKSPERLLDEVSLFLHQVVSEMPPEKQRMLEKSSNRDADLEGRRILIAEDDVRNVFALTSLLEGRGVRLQIARNGLEALTALDRSLADPALAIDLVLMDIMMPEMDGFTAMREIRSRPELKKLPIIALTAKAMKNDQEQCIEAGANDYLAKPLDIEKLLSLIRVWMPR
jgi:signal transduction histidine kinase/DNA-binding response OmpR family regulator